MFDGEDPFGFGMFGHMQRQMHEMDRMMEAMIDPFGFGMRPMRPMAGMLEDGSRRRADRNMQVGFPMSPFGSFGGIFNTMNRLQERAVNDPDSHVYMQSTTMTFDEHGRPRIVENSTRKAGDVREDRRRVRDHEVEQMEIGHSIGNRKHVIEKKRDKDGIIRSQQKFVNMDEADAEDFDREFQTRARTNIFGRHSHGNGRALTDGTAERGRSSRRNQSSSAPVQNGPIVTLPEEEEAPQNRQRESSHYRGGPIIREISDEEADSSVPKRRRGTFF